MTEQEILKISEKSERKLKIGGQRGYEQIYYYEIL